MQYENKSDEFDPFEMICFMSSFELMKYFVM